MTPDTLATVPELVTEWVCILTVAAVAVAVVAALAMLYQAVGAMRRQDK